MDRGGSLIQRWAFEEKIEASLESWIVDRLIDLIILREDKIRDITTTDRIVYVGSHKKRQS